MHLEQEIQERQRSEQKISEQAALLDIARCYSCSRLGKQNFILE